ncbi:GNAT family N-acetyltransferase [Methanocorpusculum sp. MG]|uniref:GNAT family N-acetyltransferase n=1 Tax=Methanocorpusculum petauri TaxID=3002863 RepID=A0ABT4IG41_9EURY|nr:GNAT family N-acetyltransferase [Methanocorpusculum petauri]MCZ0860160.1 GNAT family N-acetyltransferase [Methanocorpusculum petauri]MDE2443986.1 GNAT family N-acetyltransferase [Methanocorpusculum sp.]
MDQIDLSRLTVKPLHAGIDRTHFCCSEQYLNDYFKEDALKDHEYLYSITKVMEHEGHIVGFFTLVTDTINPNSVETSVGKKYEYTKLPAVKIARLATDTQYLGKGIGTAMMIWIFRIVADLTSDVGCRVITVDAKRDAVGFYQKFAFHPVQSKKETDTVPMYLDIKPLLDAHR